MTVDMVRGGLRPFIERAEQSRSLTPDQTRELLDGAAIPLFLLERLWEQAKGMIDRGVERGTLIAVLTDHIDLIDRCTQAFDDILARAGATDLAPGEVAKLEGAAQRLRGMRGVVAGQLQRLGAPLPPVDLSSLPSRSGERQAAGYVSLDDLAARLRSRETA
jgi:hypothetical protein